MSGATSSSLCRECGSPLRAGMIRCRECGTLARGPELPSSPEKPHAIARPADAFGDVLSAAPEAADEADVRTPPAAPPAQTRRSVPPPVLDDQDAVDEPSDWTADDLDRLLAAPGTNNRAVLTSDGSEQPQLREPTHRAVPPPILDDEEAETPAAKRPPSSRPAPPPILEDEAEPAVVESRPVVKPASRPRRGRPEPSTASPAAGRVAQNTPTDALEKSPAAAVDVPAAESAEIQPPSGPEPAARGWRGLPGRAAAAVRARAGLAIVAVGLLVLVEFLLMGTKGGRSLRVPAAVERTFSVRGEVFTISAFSRDGKMLVVGTSRGDVRIGDLPGGELRILAGDNVHPITSLTVAPDGFVIAGTAEKTLLGWSKPTMSPDSAPQVQSGFSAAITSIAIHPSRTEIALGLSDGELLFFGARTPLRVESKHRGGVRAVAWSPDGTSLVTGGADGRLVWRHPETGEARGDAMMTAEIGGLAFSQDGALLIVGDWNGRLAWYDVRTRKPIADTQLPDAVSGVVTLEGKVVSSSWDGTLSVWSQPGEQQGPAFSIGQPIVHLARSADGQRLSTVTADGGLLLWKSSAVLAP